MKKLVFIDNDNLKNLNCDLVDALSNLKHFGKVEIDDTKMIKIPNFNSLSKDEVYKIFFTDKNPIITWSMYSGPSFQQLERLLLAIMRNKITGINYICTSGELYRALESIFINSEVSRYAFLYALEKNNIITVDFDNSDFKRLRANHSLEIPIEKQHILVKGLLDYLEVDYK